MLLQMNPNISVTKQTNKQTIIILIKIEFRNSVKRLAFLWHIADNKIAWIIPVSSDTIYNE